MAEKEKPVCELRCRTCGKKWETTKLDDPPPWLIYYTFCHLCYVKMLEEFEAQFPKRYLPVSKKIRIEEKRNEEKPWDTDDSEAR